ncbi:hypothetical protein MicloDRAFT_00010650 [Microvirga lotononidis]|uniref:Uncharacterized protein n=1 Tax=Microvirga lotononidis TaxID=864069 RepID=I4Z218_9HYPH|nr:hypothetical protein MicloDRAFT_00010650 [Microvirga lotononidis]
MLRPDKGISVRRAEALGVSRATIRRERALKNGVVKIDGLYVSGKPRPDGQRASRGRGRKGELKTLKSPALVAVKRPPP